MEYTTELFQHKFFSYISEAWTDKSETNSKADFDPGRQPCYFVYFDLCVVLKINKCLNNIYHVSLIVLSHNFVISSRF